MECPKCGSTKVNRIGCRVTVKGKKPRLQCQNCGRTFYAKSEIGTSR